MAKTIDKLAREYATLPMDVGKGRVCIDRKEKNAFEDGANAVLTEIEQIIDNPWLLSDGSRNAGWLVALPDIIRDKIKELKGK